MTAYRELDDALVERILAGTTVIAARAQSPERTEAIRRLAARGLCDRAIGERVHMKRDAVQKVRERHGIRSGVPKPGTEPEPTWWALTRGRQQAERRWAA